MPTSTELEERCAFLERELSEVGIQLDAAQKRLKLASDVIESMRGVMMSVSRLDSWASSVVMSLIAPAKDALDIWDAVPGDEGGLHDTEGK